MVEVKVLIVRDRESAGGGIHSYYRAISPHLKVNFRYIGVGKPQSYYGDRSLLFRRFTSVRLLADWLNLVLKILWFRPALVHVNPGLDAGPLRSLRRDAICVWLAGLFGCRILVFWRGWDNSWCGMPEFPGGNNGWLCRVYKKASAHIVLAGRFRDDLKEWGFKSPVHLETTVASEELLGIERKPSSLQGSIDLLFLSRVELAKGVYELLDAYQIIRARDSRYTLTIAGDGPELENLRKYAADLKLEGVSFPGFVQGASKIECFRSAAIFCFPSYTEGMPNAVLEAMAVGLPIVCSDAGGLRDIMEDGKTGILFTALLDGEDKQMFEGAVIADAIESLAYNESLYNSISRYNSEFARSRFAASEVAKRLAAIYESISSSSVTKKNNRRSSVRC